jgi:hypothetical protein
MDKGRFAEPSIKRNCAATRNACQARSTATEAAEAKLKEHRQNTA